jgi:transcriptional regulator with XRE-family HTH domain
MPNTPHIILKARQTRQITAAHLAAFVGITIPSYWDMESHEDESWTLDVIELIRLCVVFDIAPERLLPEDAFRKPAREVVFSPDEFGNMNITSHLRALCGDITAIADTIGWEADALRSWLQDDCHLGEMPLLALNDLCRHLQLDIASVLTTYWHALGR